MRKKNPPKYQFRRTVRLSENDEKKIIFQADIAGLTVAEYMRRKILGGQILALSDEVTIRELRRLGGLLKNNFETLRQASAPKEILETQEEILKKIGKKIDEIANK